MKLSSCVTLAAVLVLALADAPARTVPGSPSAWNRLVETTSGLLRRPVKRSESPPVAARTVKQATWNERRPQNEPRPQGKAGPPAEPAKAKKKSKSGAAGTKVSSKRAAPARDIKKPPRTLYEYMAQERP